MENAIIEIEKLVQNKLAMIDIHAGQGSTKFHHELFGIKQTLRCLGYELEAKVNPCVKEDKQPSTFTIIKTEI